MSDKADYYDKEARRDSLKQDLVTARLNHADQTEIDRLKRLIKEWEAVLSAHPARPNA
jgi:hypothetical protein